MIDWIKEFGEPAAHVPETVVPLSLQPLAISESQMQVFETRRDLTSVCESPIEVDLGAAIKVLIDRSRLPLRLIPQFAWSFYRSDWAIVTPSGKTLLIECDGRNFHSTPEQLGHDSKKDAAALDRGYPTIRFAGTQIHKDSDDCARQVFDAVVGL